MTQLTVRDVMNPDLLSIDETTSLPQVAEFLLDHEISGVAVRDSSGELVGVVSLTDLAAASTEGEGREVDRPSDDYFQRAWFEDAEPEELVGLRVGGDERTAGDIMNRALYTVSADAPVSEAAEVMLDSHIHRLLVTDAGTVMGVVTTSDLLRLLASTENSSARRNEAAS